MHTRKAGKSMYDTIIRNGMIVDGTGRDMFSADIGIVGDRIEKVGDLGEDGGATVIDARGRIVTPGFIDAHSHADISFLFFPTMECYLQQGVTTVVGGNCGHTAAPMGDEVYRSLIVDPKVGFAVNPSLFTDFSLLLPKDAAIKALEEQYGIGSGNLSACN